MIELARIDRDEALRYLQYNNNINLDENMQSLLDECEMELLKTVIPRYIYKAFDISYEKEGVALIGTDLILTGKDIAQHLADCSRAILFCATLSADTDRLIRLNQVSNMAKALIIDSMANAAIEQVCDNVEEIVRDEYPEKYYTWRYSPGYGDLPLSIQPEFLTVLNAQKRIGLTVGSNLLLSPVKSVTAIMGMSDNPLNNKRKGCIGCNMYENCSFRKSGKHC